MKTPHLDTALLAAFNMIGGSSNAMEYTLMPSPEPPEMRIASRSKGRVAQNQRQRRKDRRRANAAGVRNAFK